MQFKCILSNQQIDNAVQLALDGEITQDQIQALIILEDPSVTSEIYCNFIFKFYAAMRHQLYQNIQKYWIDNKERLEKEFEDK